MRRIFGALLLSLGIYSFGFGVFVSGRLLQLEDMRHIAHPRGQIRTLVEKDPVWKHPLGLLLLCATGSTIGFSAGLHLLLEFKPKKKGRLTQPAKRDHRSMRVPVAKS